MTHLAISHPYGALHYQRILRTLVFRLFSPVRASIERSYPTTGALFRRPSTCLGTEYHLPILANDRPESVLSNISFRLDMFHDQLPLAVPCYDLLPVTEFTVVLDKPRFRVPPASLS